LMQIEGNDVFSSAPVQQTSPGAQTESFACPFCNTENNAHAFDCETCGAVLSLSDLEMLLSNQNVDTEMLRQAVERMEKAKSLPGFGENELIHLGVGHINLKNLRQGFAYLQQALQTNPNDVLLSSQVKALAIRLEEIERHDEIHGSIPKNRKILVVDDSATVRKLISGKLEKSGHEVFCAVDGMDALAKLNEVMPDLILLDITMPRMDGYQVCKLIRNNPLTKDIPVVMISGKDGFFDKVRGRMAGTTGYITKPFGPETLMKALDVYIKGNGENVFFEEEIDASIEV
ncbi:MAG TPA: response regulator, partial [Pyrinomonadaceae bacterium]